MNDKINTTANVETDRSLFSVFVRIVGLFMGVAIAYIVLYMAYKDGTTYYQTPSYTTPSMDSFSPMLVPSASQNCQNGIVPKLDGNIPADFAKMPQSKEEVIEYYKNANSKVKSQAKSVTRKYNKVTNYNNVLETGSNPILSKIGKAVMGKFLTENLEPETFTGQNEIAGAFPPPNAVCGLSVEDVESAICRDKGESFELEIHIRPETNPELGKGTGAVSTIITKKEITDAVDGYVEISNIRCDYENVYLIATVDKKTGDITELYVNMPLYLNLTALGMDCKVGLCFEDRYTVEW